MNEEVSYFLWIPIFMVWGNKFVISFFNAIQENWYATKNNEFKVNIFFSFHYLIMVFNATFNNISVISWWSVLLLVETRENHWPVAIHWQTVLHTVLSVICYSFLWSLLPDKFSKCSVDHRLVILEIISCWSFVMYCLTWRH